MHGRNTNVLTAQLDLQISKDLRKLVNHEAMDTRHRQSQIRHRQDKHKQSIALARKHMFAESSTLLQNSGVILN